jgi:tetratricopeptide (TPR) repeat protein
MASMGAIDVTAEVRDVATPARRALDEIRRHLRARIARVEKSTYYDVLEITPLAEYAEIEAAYQLVGSRYTPQALARYDLAELTTSVAATWEIVEKARGVLVDHAQRGRYTDWLRGNLAQLKTSWAIDVDDSKAAAEAFVRGQRAIGDGDAHKAMGDFARACRHHPGHPDYEANLAWVRFRVQVASGKDAREAALAERKLVESVVLGCRPWPRALVALALLCAAGGDADSARWHLAIALSIDPNVPAAAQLAQRLGLRR